MEPEANGGSDNGDSFIPASQRPDGTWRKARRVKEGYVPQEEVPLYESKGKQFMNRSSKPEPVVLASGKTAQRPIPGLILVEKEEKKSKKKKKASSNNTVDGVTNKLQNTSISKPEKAKSKPENKPSKQEENDAITPEKKLKNLKKRLREIDTLEEKIKSGSIAKPEPEQLTKIKRKNDLLMQTRQLEKQLEQ